MNSLTHYFVPQWIVIAFLISIPLPFILIVLFIRKQSKIIQQKLVYPAVSAFFLCYLSYIYLASYLGWFNQISFPPKVLLYTTFPFAFLLFVIVGNSKIYKNILKQSELKSIVLLHIFRLIGLFFILLAANQALPKTFAYVAGIGDILTAICSIFVAKAIQNKKSYAIKLTFWWNIFGTVDILFTAIAANVITKLSIDNGTMSVDTLAQFPFCIIPAFAPPIILFLHWSIHKKLKKIST